MEVRMRARTLRENATPHVILTIANVFLEVKYIFFTLLMFKVKPFDEVLFSKVLCVDKTRNNILSSYEIKSN
jgi:hypothetical protein